MTTPTTSPATTPTARYPVDGGLPEPSLGENVALVDLLDRVLATGVVLSGELTIVVADVELVHISLRALISSVRPDLFGPEYAGGPDG